MWNSAVSTEGKATEIAKRRYIEISRLCVTTGKSCFDVQAGKANSGWTVQL